MLDTVALTPRFEIIEPERFSPSASLLLMPARIGSRGKFTCLQNPTRVNRAGEAEAPHVVEVKRRKGGTGFVTIGNWLANYDALILRRNNSDPIVCVPWRVWARLLKRARQ
jgi:hypothetical protein